MYEVYSGSKPDLVYLTNVCHTPKSKNHHFKYILHLCVVDRLRIRRRALRKGTNILQYVAVTRYG